MNDSLKKLTIDSKRIPISWEKQRAAINARIYEDKATKRSLVLIHRWVDITALIVICAIAGWFLIDHTLSPRVEVSISEEEFFEKLDAMDEGSLPESLVVLNDIEEEEESYYDESTNLTTP